MLNKISLELELVPLEEGAEHDLEYFREELKEFFENFGWKITYMSSDEEDEDE